MIKKTINHSSRNIHSPDFARIIELLGELEDAGYHNPQLIVGVLGDGDVWVSSSLHSEAQRYPLVSFGREEDILKVIEKTVTELKREK